MKNIEHTPRRLFIIGFGDSRRYRLLLDEGENLDRFADAEREINAFLSSHFPGEEFTYFTTPSLEEVSVEDREYDGYPEFSHDALRDIESHLLREVQVMHADRRLDANDQWGSINAD